MAKPLFTPEQIHEAADAMAAEGTDVTALGLLSRLGGGSLSTIYKHWRTWKEQRRQSAISSNPQTIPDSVQAVFATALGKAWAVMGDEAGKQVAAAKAKASEDTQEANKQFEEAVGAIERLEQQSEIDNAQIERLAARVAELEARLQRSEQEKSGLLVTTEQQSHQLKSQANELERIHKELDSEQRRRLADMERSSNALAEARETATKKIDELKQALVDAQHQAERAMQEKVTAQAQQEKSEDRSRVLEEEAAVLRTDKEKIGQEAAQLRGQLESLKEQNNELLAKLTNPKNKN